MRIIEFFKAIKERWKSSILLLCTTFMPFLDDHSEKLLMAFMAVLSYETFNKETRKKKKKER